MTAWKGCPTKMIGFVGQAFVPVILGRRLPPGSAIHPAPADSHPPIEMLNEIPPEVIYYAL